MKRLTILCSLLLLLVTSGCKKALEGAFKQDSSGTPYDLYVVIEDHLRQIKCTDTTYIRSIDGRIIDIEVKDTLCNTPLYDSILSVFEYPMSFMPNSDPFFHVRKLTPDNFQSPVIRSVANVVIVDISPSNATEPIITHERDRFSNNQVIVRMHARSAHSLAEYLPQVQEQLRNIFVKNELNRRIAVLQEEHNIKQQDRLMQMHEVSMLFPKTMSLKCIPAADTTRVFWITDGYAEKPSFVVAYSVPYTDQNIFTLEGALAVRDSVMSANITGDQEVKDPVTGKRDTITVHMTTRREIVVPQYRALEVGGHYLGELTGMWRMPGMTPPMAGPFICHIRLDEVRKRVVFVEGFCYAPKTEEKRLMIRNLEATLYTLKLPSDNLIPEIEVTL